MLKEPGGKFYPLGIPVPKVGSNGLNKLANKPMIPALICAANICAAISKNESVIRINKFLNASPTLIVPFINPLKDSAKASPILLLKESICVKGSSSLFNSSTGALIIACLSNSSLNSFCILNLSFAVSNSSLNFSLSKKPSTLLFFIYYIVFVVIKVPSFNCWKKLPSPLPN